MDTVKKIQIGDDPSNFTSLERFVKTQGLHKVSFDQAKRKGRYTVFVLNDETVQKSFVSGISKSNVIRAMEANRGERRFDVRREDFREAWVR